MDARRGGAEPGAVVRRAPFSTNPLVGARGLRTQQKILDAALRVFGDVGYHRTSIDRIAREAGCSRISFYQYVSDKADVFRHLAAQVDRQLNASIDQLDELTPDADGWAALRGWVGRYADVRARYEPVFRAFPAAAESDAVLAGASLRTGSRYRAAIASRVSVSPLPPRELEPLLELCLEGLSRTLDDVATLHAAAPDAFPRDRVLDTFADVMHRTLFGLQPAVNDHTNTGPRPPKLPRGPVFRDALEPDGSITGAAEGGAAFAELVDAGRRVFVSRGFHGTRVDDIVTEAGMSHGAFYRYFKNKDRLAVLLAAHAMHMLSDALDDIPATTDDAAADRAALRRWLRAYVSAQTGETAMIRVWSDAAIDDDDLVVDSAAILDWGRRRMARFLAGRPFGDADIDGVVLLAFIDTIGTKERSARTIDAGVAIIDKGFLGR